MRIIVLRNSMKQRCKMRKLIILIGGTAGCGKTTIARKIAASCNINHRLGTGFIREVVRSQTAQAKEPYLFTYTFDSDDPVNNLAEQSRRLMPAVIACIKRARNEGTSLIIEGNHLLPELYANCDVDRFCILEMPPVQEMAERLMGATHSQRKITIKDIESISKINDHLMIEAKKYEIPIMSDDLDKMKLWIMK
jgi:2-phosphoglycerate kinase